MTNRNRLTNKQRAFINEYFLDFNGTRAAERAGYKGNDATLAVVASENLKKPRIREHIRKRFEAQALAANEVLYQLREQIQFDIGDLLDDAGVFQLAQAKEKGLTRFIKSISWTKGSKLRIETYDKQRALELIGKHLRMFVERHEVGGIDGAAIKLDVIRIIEHTGDE